MISGAAPRFGYLAPVETFNVPLTLKSFERITPTAEDAQPKQKAASKDGAGMPRVSDGRREKYKAARMRGLGYEEAGREAGFKWSNRQSAYVCGRTLDVKLGIAGKVPSVRATRDEKKVIEKPRQAHRDGRGSSHIRDTIAELTAKRDELDNAIRVLEKIA